MLNRCERVLVETEEALDAPDEVVAENVRYIGPLVEGPGPDAAWSPPWGDDTRPLVVVSMGTTAIPGSSATLDAVLSALDGPPLRVFATAGDPAEP